MTKNGKFLVANETESSSLSGVAEERYPREPIFRSRGRRLMERTTMKLTMIAGAAALAMLLSGQALAQSVEVEIAPEQRTHIKEYVVKEKVAPVRAKERISVGAILPADVELRTVPSDWGPWGSRYRYVYHDNHVVLVEPSSRKVIRIIE
jgi:uncharacterized protein DUF1236